MNTRDVEGFQKVIKYLDENQKGSFGITHLNRYQMMVLKYVGLGEGMEYYCMEPYDLEDLIKELNKKTTEEE